MLRYSLGALLGAVLLAAVGCAALVNPTPLWSQIVFTAVVLLLLGAAVWAVVGRPRPFAAGFAIFGWGYLLLTSGPWAPSVRPHLLTETALAKLAPRVVDPNQVYPGAVFLDLGSNLYTGGGTTLWAAPNNPFVYTTNVLTYPTLTYPTLTGAYNVAAPGGNVYLHQIGHTLWAILFGVVGGALARRAAQRPPKNAGDLKNGN